MGTPPPGGFERLAGAAQIAVVGQQSSHQRRGGNQAGRERDRLLGQRQRRFRIALGRFLGHRGFQRGAPADRGRPVDQVRGGVGFDDRQRASPVGMLGAIVEHRLRRPRQRGVLVGAARIIERRGMIASPARLDVQAAQAKGVGFG